MSYLLSNQWSQAIFWGRQVYWLSPLVWERGSSPWGSNPINTEESVEMYLLKPPVFFPTVEAHLSNLRPSAFQQFLACSPPVFVEPSQWEVGSRHILHSPADWSEHFIFSGTDFGLVKHTHISVYFCRTRLRLGVFLCESALWPARCYSTRCYLSDPFSIEDSSKYFLFIFLLFNHIFPSYTKVTSCCPLLRNVLDPSSCLLLT